MTPAGAIASAKALTDQTGSDQGGTEAELYAWLGEDFPALVRRISKVVPDYYKRQVVATLSGAPTNPVGKFKQILQVERLVGDRWLFVPPADPNRTGAAFEICWRAIGANIELLPADTSATTSVRIEYVPAVALPGLGAEMDIPDGFEGCLIHLLAKRIRIRLDQAYRAHDEEYVRIWSEGVASIIPTATQPRHVSDYNADADEGGFW